MSRGSLGGLLDRSRALPRRPHEVIHIHRLVRIMRAIFVADEDHGAGNAGIGEYRRVVSGAARDRLVRQAELAAQRCRSLSTQSASMVAGADSSRRSSLNSTPRSSPMQAHSDTEQVVERLERLLALAA